MNTANSIAMVLSAALRLLHAVQGAFGVSKDKIQMLLMRAIDEDRDVSAAEIEELIASADAAINRLESVLDEIDRPFE